MSEEPKPKQKIRKGPCTYRVNSAICIRATGQWIPEGVIADLGDCEDVFLTWALQTGLIETAEPSESEPLFNTAEGKVKRPPCPCGQ